MTRHIAVGLKTLTFRTWSANQQDAGKAVILGRWLWNRDERKRGR
jgi:hypothetical protein